MLSGILNEATNIGLLFFYMKIIFDFFSNKNYQISIGTFDKLSEIYILFQKINDKSMTQFFEQIVQLVNTNHHNDL